jgi:uncharacterized protein
MSRFREGVKAMSIDDLLADYQTLPEYSGLKLSDVNTKSLFNDYPIHIAATRGSIEEMSLLLAHGADINAAGEHGYLPIHDAVEQDKVAAISWLIENGALVDVKNDVGLTPGELAKVLNNKGAMDILDILLG